MPRSSPATPTRKTSARSTPSSTPTKSRALQRETPVKASPKKDAGKKTSGLRVFFADDDESDVIREARPKKDRRPHDTEEQDEALVFRGKYEGAMIKIERHRGELKGSQVFGFKTPNPNRTGRSSRVRVDEKENASAYFEARGYSLKTSDKTLSQLKTPKLSKEEIDDLLTDLPNPYESEIDQLFLDYRAKFDKWHNLLLQDFSIVTFGFGSKKKLLQEFHETKLSESDCIIINGFFPSLTLKHVLTAFTDDILGISSSFANPAEHLNAICDALRNPNVCDVFLLIHNIDGPMLRGDKTQSALAQLASQPKVHLLCSVDHINAPLIWDQRKLTKFNFVWFDATTYLPYAEETRYENSFLVTQTGQLELNSLLHVFASLNHNAKGIFLKLVSHQLNEEKREGGDSGGGANNGLAFSELYQRCREAFLVNSDLTLRAQLTEFKDHKLVNLKKGPDGVEYLTIPLSNATLKEFLEEESNYT